MKKVNETVWKGILDRGRGETVRKEDEVPQEIQKALASYIDMFASIAFKGDYVVDSWPDFKAFVKDYREAPRMLQLRYNMENLLQYAEDHWEDVVLPTIEDAVNNVNATVDDIIDKLNNPDVNESTWGGMLDRGAGETVRKEDELTDEEHIQLKQYITDYGYEVVYGWGRGTDACKFDEFCDYLKKDREADSKIINYVKAYWFDEICDLVDASIEERQNDSQEEYVNESTWGGILDRGTGDTVRKEEFTEEFIDKVKSELIGFIMSVVYYIKNYELTFDGFYKYLEEIESPDEIKKIIYYVKTNKNECDKLLEKDIKFENKYLDEKVNGYLLRFVDNIVYDEKYHNTFSDIKKFASEIFKGHESPYYFNINEKQVFKDKSELFNDYIEDKWKNGFLKQKIDDLIKNENDEISKCGFVKEPGKTISETVDDWWYSLDEDKRDDLGWDEFGDDAEEEYYTDHNPKYNEYDGEDFNADEWWNDAWGIKRVKIYCSEHSKTNESTWGGMLDRGAGETVRKEDEVLNDDENHVLDTLARMCLNAIRIRKDRPDTKRGFIEYIEDRKKDNRITLGDKPLGDELYDRLINYVNKNWGDCDGVQEFLNEKIRPIELKESVWGDVLDRGRGTTVRKEDDLTFDDIKFIVKSFIDRIVYFEEYKNKIDDLEDLIERSWDLPGRKDAKEMAQKQIGYVRRNWQKIEKIIDDGINELEEKIKKIGFVKKAGESPFDTLYSWWDSLDKKIQKEIIDSLEYDDDYDDPKDIWESLSWDEQMTIYVKWSNTENVIKECEGVPGGATPASVGGMGAAYFPGPDGTPGSGDLPSPTGIVYHQVAPYTMFLKQIKKKKKKSKKFRKEDEPCVHSPNAKVYDYVDDFREYVDRTYNNMDRK